MREELRRSNTIGDIRGILHFTNVILENDSISKETAHTLCSFVKDIRINFDSAIYFFEYLDLIILSTDLISPTAKGRELFLAINHEFEESLCKLCLNAVTVNKIIDISALKFDSLSGKYYIQKYGFPIHTALFRNILIQFQALAERPDGALEIATCYEFLFIEARKSIAKVMSLESMKKQLEEQEEQGEKAELYVLEYERNRLAESDNSSQVKRISEIDVSAGYDIVSYDDKNSAVFDRFIEVKSFKGNVHFYWSKNEIDVAMFLGDKYYIYLINIDEINEPNYIPHIIKNPSVNVLNSEKWLMQSTSFFVLPTEN